ncbi:MAG: helix-turn-helix transcriptional regulator [Demequina sp.]
MRGITTLASLGAAIRAERESAGLSQSALAGIAGVSRATIIALESGSRFEAATMLAAIKALGLAVELVPAKGASRPAAASVGAAQYDATILDDTEDL